MRLVWSVLAALVLAAGAVAQELPWYEVTVYGNTSTSRSSSISLFESGYYGVSVTSPVDNQTRTVLYNRDGLVISTPFDVISAVDESGTAYGYFRNASSADASLTNGYFDLDSGGPFVETNLTSLQGGTKDYFAGAGPGAVGAFAKDPSNPNKSLGLGVFLDSNKNGTMIGYDPFNVRSPKVYVPGLGLLAVKNASDTVLTNRVKQSPFDVPLRVLEDGGLFGQSGLVFENGTTVRKALIWDTPDSEPRVLDLNNLSAADSARIGVIPYTASGKDGLQLMGAEGSTVSLAERIVNPSTAGPIFGGSTTLGIQLDSVNSAGFITGSYSVRAEDGSILRYDVIAKPVPEPATIAVIGLGVCGLLGRKRFRSATRRDVK